MGTDSAPIAKQSVRPWTEAATRQPIVRGGDLVVGPIRCPVARSSREIWRSVYQRLARWQRRGVWSGRS